MLARARKRAARLGAKVRLLHIDIQHLDFKDNTFDTVVSIFFFCSVPDPVLDLKEVVIYSTYI